MPDSFSWVANALPPTCPASLGRSKAKSDRDVAKSQDVCLECLCFRVLAAMGEVLTEWGGRRCPPPGGFQSAAHRRCAGRARPQSHRLQPKLQIYQQMAKFLMACSSSCFEGSYTPLFFSPQEPGDHRRPCAKKRKNGTLWLFFSIFCFSKLQSKFCTEKTSKKVGKSMVFATQTPPKTRTKSCFCCKQRFLKNRAPA